MSHTNPASRVAAPAARRRLAVAVLACVAAVVRGPMPALAAQAAEPVAAFKALAGTDFAQVNARDGDAGFLAEYFTTPDLSGRAASDRLEPSTAFSAGAKPPIPGYAGGAYSVRWTGTITPARTATFTLALRGVAADARLLIDGKPLVTLAPAGRDFAARSTATVDLVADKSYEVVVELRNVGTGVRLASEWSAAPATGAPVAPRVAPVERVVGPAAGAVIGGAVAPLENATYRLESAADGTLTLIERATGVRAVFRPEFYVARATGPIDRANGKYVDTGPVGSTNYKVPAWNKETDYFYAMGERVRLRPVSVTAADGGLSYAYASQPEYALTARVTLPADGSEPKLTYELKVAGAGKYTVGFAGAPSVPPGQMESMWQPLIWNGKRFPNASYLSEEYQCPVPAALVSVGGATVGVAADPDEMPFRMPTGKNSRFGVLVRNPAGEAQPALFAPVLGGAESEMAAGAKYAFTLRLFVRKGDWYSAYRYLGGSLYRFSDVRENGLCSLNTTIENMAEYLLTPQYSYWYAEHKTWGYQNDAAGSGRQQSAADPISLALVLDDRRLLETLAFPSLEYFVSRKAAMIRIAGPDPKNYMGGPVPSSYTDLVAAYELSGGRMTSLRRRLMEAYPAVVERAPAGTPAALKAAMVYHLARYRLTRDPASLRSARAAADQYIAVRIERPAATFNDDIGSSFWNEIGPYWDVLYELYNETGEPTYLAAATKGVREFTGFVNLVPPIPPGDFTANPGGVYNGQPVPEEVVPAWRVAANGLTAECAGTASSHRGIFMAPYASYFARIALDADDTFFLDIARSSTVGRYANYPSYAYRNGYSTVYEKADYPLRSFEEIKKFTSAHYNHPLPMTAFLVDYLVAETYYRSKRKVDFPAAYTNTGAYFKNKVFGHAPGKFYDETGVWLWLPRKLVSFDNVQVNYVSGHGNGKLYLALSNASARPVTTTLTLNPALVRTSPGAAVKVWTDNVAGAALTLKGDQLTVTISPKGITAVAIEGVTPRLDVQAGSTSPAKPLPDAAYQVVETPHGTARAMILTVGDGLSRAYVYLDSDRKQLASATLTYTAGGTPVTVTDDAYPFEFSVPLGAGVGEFAFTLKTVPPAGGEGTAATSKRVTLPTR